MARLVAYTIISTALASSVLLKAVSVRTNFFSACIYLSQSNACVILLVNFLILTVGTIVFGLQRLLYGPLRPIEAEQLYDKAWFAITETCLAMTIFRDEIGVWFVALFVCLLVGKVWAWIGEGRVEILDQQPPADPRSFHIRLSISLLLSLSLDTYLLNHSIQTVRRQAKPNMMVMFAFEFAVLATSSLSTAFRYLISLQEAAIIRRRTIEQLQETRSRHQQERIEASVGGENVEHRANEDEMGEADIEVPEWEEKSRWILYLDLLTDFIRLVLYLIFFVMLCVFYGMPLHIIRDVALALRSFHKRFTDFVRYKHATRDMNERYADATAENLQTNDVCIICREVMRPWMNGEATGSQRSRSKLLSCGHVLHLGCLKRWLQWQQSCPTCRQPVLQERAHPNEQNNLPGANVGINAPEVRPNPDHRMAQIQAHAPVSVPTRAPLTSAQNSSQHMRDSQQQDMDIGPNGFAGANGVNQRRQSTPPAIPNSDPPRPQQFQSNRIGIQTIPYDEQNPDTQDAPGLEIPAIPLVDTLTLPLHLDAVEHQIAQLIENLRTATGHLARIRTLQEEAFRTSILRNNEGQPQIQLYRGRSGAGILSPRSERLPPGLSLPTDWNLVLLARADEGRPAPHDDRTLVPTTSNALPSNAGWHSSAGSGDTEIETHLPGSSQNASNSSHSQYSQARGSGDAASEVSSHLTTDTLGPVNLEPQ